MEVKKIEPKRIEPKNILDINEQYGYDEKEEDEQIDLLKQFLEYLRKSKERDMAKLKKSGAVQ